jgi:hypothetical protein
MTNERPSTITFTPVDVDHSPIRMQCLVATATRPWSGGTMNARGRWQMLPQLLLVGAGNSDDHGPAGSCRRLSGERGGAGGPISGEVGSLPPSHVALTPPGLTGSDLDRMKETKEEECGPMGSRKALPYGWRILYAIHGHDV